MLKRSGAGHLNFALNRLYHACFHAVTALLQSDGKQFKRHSGVRSALGQYYIKPGRIEKRWSHFYGNLFEDRQEGDYLADKTFEADDISERLRLAREFVRIVRGLIPSA